MKYGMKDAMRKIISSSIEKWKIWLIYDKTEINPLKGFSMASIPRQEDKIS